jgi:uncharacterized protein YidB (DUF937 family)
MNSPFSWNVVATKGFSAWIRRLKRGDLSMLSGPMKAFLGMLAVAGYQNRDKIGEFIKGLQSGPQGETSEARAGQTSEAGRSGPMGGLEELLGGLTSGGILSGGLKNLLKTFQG